jgi:hypothetical protein
MSNGMQGVKHSAYQAHLGGGLDVEMEVREPGELWIATGPGVGTTDLWVKAVGGKADFRVRLQRTENGFEVLLDRGELQVPWWSPDAAPRLIVTLDGVSETVSITACGTTPESDQSGAGRQIPVFPLGRIALGNDVRESDT